MLAPPCHVRPVKMHVYSRHFQHRHLHVIQYCHVVAWRYFWWCSVLYFGGFCVCNGALMCAILCTDWWGYVVNIKLICKGAEVRAVSIPWSMHTLSFNYEGIRSRCPSFHSPHEATLSWGILDCCMHSITDRSAFSNMGKILF